jgi:hypothetical protein
MLDGFMPTIGDVVVDRLRERVGLLEDHADPAPHLDRIHAAAVDVLTVVGHLAGDSGPEDEIVHPVQRSQQRGLAAARRPDQRGDLIVAEGQVDTGNRPEVTVVDVHVAALHHRIRGLGQLVVARVVRLEVDLGMWFMITRDRGVSLCELCEHGV